MWLKDVAELFQLNKVNGHKYGSIKLHIFHICMKLAKFHYEIANLSHIA